MNDDQKKEENKESTKFRLPTRNIDELRGGMTSHPGFVTHVYIKDIQQIKFGAMLRNVKRKKKRVQ